MSEFGIWLVTGINAFLVGTLIWVLKGIDGNQKAEIRDLKKIRGVGAANTQKLADILYKIHTTEIALREDLQKLRRAMVRTALLVKRRRQEATEIRKLATGAHDRLQTHYDFIHKGLERTDELTKRVTGIGDESINIKVGKDTFIIKGKKKNE